MRVWLGIDPGKNGGIAVIWESGRTDVQVYDSTALIKTARSIRDDDVIACVEKVGAMPKQGVTSTFNFGTGYGIIQGVLMAYNIPFQLVPPQKWKKEFGLNSDKQRSIEVCQRLFPEVNLYRTERCTVKHDGMAEALLMALYAKRRLE